MERTVPKVASEEVELYLRTYYSLLRSSTEVKIRTLVEAHAGMNSLLHSAAREEAPDMSAFIYCLLRLPSVMPQLRLVVLGQSQDVFSKNGLGDVGTWEPVAAPARRRRCFYNGSDTLACLIASRSDIDDLIPLLTAYQIEWNKFHLLLRELPGDVSLSEVSDDISMQQKVANILQISQDDLSRLLTIWGDEFSLQMEQIAAQNLNLRVQLLSGSLSEYRRATHAWWDRIAKAVPEISEKPVYFVSSNSHSLVNIITGFALHHEGELVHFLEESQDDNLLKEWADIQAQEVPSSRENFFYYLLKKYFQTPAGNSLQKARQEVELSTDIMRITSEHSFDLEAQVIKLSSVNTKMMDPRLHQDGDELLKQSDALIINIDYPLGMAANDILQEVSEHVGEVLGVYIVGKAATLNGVVGDVMIPKVVYDGHSRNTYIFSNCFDAAQVDAYLSYGSVLDNQKAVTVRGTFLQNSTYMDVFYNEGYTDIEMEAGPYLSAVYEMFRPKRHPRDEIVNLYDLPFDLGILHYASDKPLSKGKNLGVANLSYFGMDPTYATSLPVLRRIFELEGQRVAGINQ
ncbi:MAG: hypothetical protein FVQ83_11565 [Chloroflexi bacterium]|nr:hypothetical protein [Chloroflexota bacterium]